MDPENRRRRKPKRTDPDMTQWTPAEREKYLQRKRMETPIAELEVSVRVVNTLEENGVILVQHVMSQTYESLMTMKNFGEKTLEELRAAIRRLGIEPPAWRPPNRVRKDDIFDL